MKGTILAAAAGLLALTLAPNTHAAIATQLQVSDGTNSVTVDVSDLNVVTCSDSAAGAICAGLLITGVGAAPPTKHEVLHVAGKFANFNLDFTGTGGVENTRPTLQNFNQINAKKLSGGAGTLTALFTDTAYTDLGSALVLGVSGVNDSGISSSTSDFYAYESTPDAVPAINLIGKFENQTGISYSNSGSFANPGGASGSLTQKTVLAFAGVGTMQANFTISNAVPEPASVVLFGTTLLGLTALLRKKRQAKS